MVAAALLLIPTACAAPTETALRVPWQALHKVAETAPNNQTALWTDGTKTVLAWPGGPDQPGIRLSNGTNETVLLPFGTLQQVALYPADAGLLHILWLDQTHPDEPRLASALITTDGKIERGANAVSAKATTHYAAVRLANGNVLTLWIEARQHSPLYAQLLDGADRAHPPVRLSSDASYPTGMVDLNGTLHLAWLENAASQSWTIRYLTFNNSSLPDTDNPSTIPVAVIKLGAGESLEDFALGMDGTHVYCLWNSVFLNSTGQPIGSLAGLAFPIGNVSAVQQIKLDALREQNVHGLSIPIRAMQTLTISLTNSTWDSQAWNDNPIAVSVTPDSAVLHPVYDEPVGILGKTTLASDANGKLYLAWTLVQADGTAAVYYASTGS